MTRAELLQLTVERAKRLISFCESDAPDYLIGAEVELIRRGVYCLGDNAVKMHAKRLVESARAAAGLCISEDCLEPAERGVMPVIANFPEHARVYAAFRETQHCKRHADELRADMAAMLGREPQ